METGLFEIQADHLRRFKQARQTPPISREVVYAMFCRVDSTSYDRDPALRSIMNAQTSELKTVAPAADRTVELTRCFVRLANLPNFALDRLSRYEATLWRQAGRILFALDALDRRRPQERRRYVSLRDLADFERE
jgi:hypothetical protein